MNAPRKLRQLFSDLRLHYAGMVAFIVRRNFPAEYGATDQHQQNAMYGLHQMRVRLPDDPTVYRLIVAPANAPIFVGRENQIPIDQHFLEPIDG